MWGWLKITKGIALIAFILPWMTVSCAGQKLMSATGAGLAFGSFTSFVPMGRAGSGSPSINIWLIIALAAVVGGLIASFGPRSRVLMVLGTSLGALALILLGTARYSKSELIESARRKSGSFDEAAAGMIQIDWHFGYWLAVIALIGSAVMAWLVLADRDKAVLDSLRDAAKPDRDPQPPAGDARP
jgi:hypothetical protein